MTDIHSIQALVGRITILFGKILFLLSFWYTGGFYLGGDDMYLGFLSPYQEIVFPLCGLGLFLASFGMLIAKKQLTMRSGHLFTICLILGLIVLNAYFSWQPGLSIWYVLLFLCAFQVLLTKDEWNLFHKPLRILWMIGTLIGLTAHFLSPENVASSALELSFLVLFIAWLRDPQASPKEKNIGFALCIFGLAGLQSIIGLFVILAMIMLGNPWLSRTEKRRKDVLLPPLFLTLAVLLWGTLTNTFTIAFPPNFGPGYLLSWKQLLLGLGAGQYFVAMAQLSPVILSPEAFTFPNWGFVIWFWEFGLLGSLILLLCLFVRLSFMSRYKHIFPLIIWVWGIMVGSIFFAENALLFWLFIVMNPGLFHRINPAPHAEPSESA